MYRFFAMAVVFQIFSILLLLETCASFQVPAHFVFGDSLADAGNNNYIYTLSKADYFPNGIDLGIPTGRYTNGRTIVDIVGQALGFKDFTPPYLAPTTAGSVLLQGVNYASGGGGILNSTGAIFVGRINLDAQIDNFADTREDIIAAIGGPKATALIQTSLFSVAMGSNDFINNLFEPGVTFISPRLFVTTMIVRFKSQLTRLYSLGARKIVVSNVGPLGCIPYQRDVNPGSGDNCVRSTNEIANFFNTELKQLTSELGSTLDGSKFVYADVYRIFSDIIQNYASYGFENPSNACCYVAGRFGGLIPCGLGSSFCMDRSKFVFWDPYHPTDAVNSIIAKRLLDGDTNDISPMNIRQLVAT